MSSLTAVNPGTSLSPTGPDWEFLISHHLPERHDRTIAVTVRSHCYHLCARCSGQLVGVAAWLGVYLVLLGSHISIFDPTAQTLVALLPLPAAVDWVTQATGHRSSRNSLRVVSGILLGGAFTDLIASAILGRWIFFLGGVSVMALYFASLLIVLRVTGAWKAVLREHFPGIEVP